MANRVFALTLSLLPLGLADTSADQPDNCAYSVSDAVMIGHLTVDELSFFSLSFSSTANSTGSHCAGTFKLTDSGQECLNRLSGVYGTDASRFKQDDASINEILTALNGVRSAEPISFIMSNQEGELVVEETEGLQIQFSWRYKKPEDRVRVVGGLVLDVDEQLKSLCSR